MWTLLDYYGMYLPRISHSCEFVKVDPSVILTMTGLVSDLLF